LYDGKSGKKQLYPQGGKGKRSSEKGVFVAGLKTPEVVIKGLWEGEGSKKRMRYRKGRGWGSGGWTKVDGFVREDTAAGTKRRFANIFLDKGRGRRMLRWDKDFFVRRHELPTKLKQSDGPGCCGKL